MSKQSPRLNSASAVVVAAAAVFAFGVAGDVAWAAVVCGADSRATWAASTERPGTKPWLGRLAEAARSLGVGGHTDQLTLHADARSGIQDVAGPDVSCEQVVTESDRHSDGGGVPRRFLTDLPPPQHI